MLEKLLENWLDKASERSYQSVFVQMLAAEGYTILHSTRHCLLEFGKDILAIAPDGVGCAFQLKGDPRGRMQISEFRKDIQPQLVQLMAQSPSYPGFPAGPHRAYLVSNGQFEEEVHAAVREMNNGPYPSKTTLWARGKLFEMCKAHGSSLWPSELEDNRALLELYMANPRDSLPVTTLAGMLESVLGLSGECDPLKKKELSRAASSAAWLTGVATATYAEQENHQAVITAWVMCCVSIVGACARHDGGSMKHVDASFKLACAAVVDALTTLWNEVSSRTHLTEGEVFTDSDILDWRIGTLYGMLSSLSIADEEMHLLDASARNELHSWLKSSKYKLVLWGEGAVANVVPWLVWLRKNEPTTRPDQEIDMLANTVIQLNQPKSLNALASPYYDFESVLRHYYQLKSIGKGRSLDGQSIAGGSYTAELALHLLVRTNLKGRCKSLWSRFTRLSHHRLDVDFPWQYCLFESPHGTNSTRIYPSTYEWAQLKTDALDEPADVKIPGMLKTCPWLLGLWWQVAPHRLNSESVHAFTEAIIPSWGR